MFTVSTESEKVYSSVQITCFRDMSPCPERLIGGMKEQKAHMLQKILNKITTLSAEQCENAFHFPSFRNIRTAPWVGPQAHVIQHPVSHRGISLWPLLGTAGALELKTRL